MPPTAAYPAHFTLLLFGFFRLCAGDEDIPLRGRKACALLAFLALAPDNRASREQLADLLWTDRGSEQARASLRQTLAELRAIDGMESALAIARSEIALQPGHFDSDLGRILAACEASAVSELAHALANLRGGLLESFGDISPGFDEWAAVERPARLEQVVSQSLVCLEQSGMTSPEDAQAVLRSLDRLDPFNEGVARLGMRLDHAAGDSAALHRRYRRLADQLQNEFGAAPAEATRSLFQQLTRPRTAEDPAAPAAETAPKPPTPTAARPRSFASGDELVPSVVVAPLQVFEKDGDFVRQAEFCSDDIRVAISALGGMKVLDIDAQDIAALAADSADSLGLYLFSGKVRDTARGRTATLQLANAQDHAILWSESIALGEGPDPFEPVVAKSVGAIQPAIDRDLDAALRGAARQMTDERALFTQARLVIRGATNVEEVRKGVGLLERVIERNPRHLGAHLLLVRMHNTDFWQQLAGHDVAAFRAKAAHHMEIAAGIEPNRVDVRVHRAWTIMRQGSHDLALKGLEAVLSDRQLDPDILDQCAFGLCHLGELDRADTLMQQAFELNPFAPSDYHADFAVIQALKGEAGQAEEHFLVSGETGLQYDAVRIANFASLGAVPVLADAVLARFVTRFQAAWQGDAPPRLEDAIEWVGYTLPFRKVEHADFITVGLRQVLREHWPAS